MSGRFIELASLTSPPGQSSPATLQPVLAEIAKYQKADGHFGLEMDFPQPMKRLSPPIPMLWGNARLLVGLVAAAQERHDAQLLALPDGWAISTFRRPNIFCSPAREGELRATGTGGDGYTCCYFPAIEGLAHLYRATHEERYLQQAERMAEWFKRFDALPIDHSHGNLCAWRGILELYAITRKARLSRPGAGQMGKWRCKTASSGHSAAWASTGTHSMSVTKAAASPIGCGSTWSSGALPASTRFLDMAERLLLNQYAANQCPNGGYGVALLRRRVLRPRRHPRRG